jgi:type VI secretion system protein ImpE
MLAERFVREGNLQGALQEVQEHLRNRPEDCYYRTVLFQLLAVFGQWERALHQLNVLSNLETSARPMVQLYREAIRCEVLRAEIFAGRRQPLIFGEPPPWLALVLASLRLTAEGQYTQAQALCQQGFELASPSSGTIDEQPFTWIADADTRLGPVLEIIVSGRYYWAPFQHIRAISIPQVTDLRDLVWLPAHFTWINEGQAYGLIPTRYPDSEKVHDSSIQLARKTEWLELADGIYHGLGQRMLATDQDEYPLLDIRKVTVH